MDDIAQVVEMEYKGVYYVFKGTTSLISYLAKAVKAISDFAYDKFHSRSGACTWSRLQDLSEGNPVVLEFPKEMLEEKMNFPGEKEPMTMFEHYCKENKLHYTVLPDFNPDDDYIPVGVLSQDMAIHEEHIKSVMNRRISEQEYKDKTYSEVLGDLNKKLSNATDSNEIEKLKVQIENVKEAMNQNAALLSESKDKLEKNNVIDFIEYLKQGEDTNFSKDPKKALEQMEEQGILKELMPNECMMPIRDESLIPESGEIYYTQASNERIYSILRTFKKDDNGVIYSDYRAVNPDNSNDVVEFSDKNMTTKEFEDKLPKLLEDAGISAKEPTLPLRDKSYYATYLQGINFSKTQDDRKENLGYSSDEAKEFVQREIENQKVRRAYDKSRERSFIVPVDKVLLDDNERLVIETEGGLLEGANISFSDDIAQVTISKDKDYNIVSGDDKEVLSGVDVINNLSPDEKAVSSSRAKAKVR